MLTLETHIMYKFKSLSHALSYSHTESAVEGGLMSVVGSASGLESQLMLLEA